MTEAPSRRQRLRTATLTDIKRVARDLLVYGGPAAISLRAIARSLGMSAPALYRYFPSLDALIQALNSDLFDELAGELDRAAPAGAPPAARLAAMARGFRRWSIGHPAEFGLMFGSPLGDSARDGRTPVAVAPAVRFGAAFLEPFIQLWCRCGGAGPDVPELGRALAPLAAAHGGKVPPAALAASLAAWTRLFGLVAMEVFGHLRWAVTDVEPLFEAELAGFLGQLGSPA